MAGNQLGGKRAAVTNKHLHGEDFFRRIGAIGGRNGTTGGFHANPELARICGALGGSISKRGGHKMPELERLKVRKAYEELMKIHRKAQREREREAAYNVG